MKILNRLLILLLTSFLFLMSVGAEEPIKSDEQQTTTLNAEDAEEETNKILENDTNAIVEENNNKASEDIENSETADEGESTTVEAPIQVTNPSTEEEITSNSNNSELTEDQQQSELGKLTYELIYSEDKTYATLIVTYDGECKELTIANQQTLDPLVEKGLYVVNMEKGDWVNSIAFDIYSNGVVPLDVNIWGESYEEPLGTLRLEVVISELKEKVVEKVVEVPVKYDVTANVEGSSSQSSMTVTYTHVNSYNWTIPTGFDLNNGSKLTISVTNPEISEEAALKIKVNSLNNYRLVGADPDNTSTMSYTITNENGVALNNANNVALQYNMDTDTGTKSSNLTFNYNKNDALYTDTYSDQLNFTAQIGLGSGTKINIGDKKYTIIDQVGDNQYLVMERDSLGNIQYNPNVDENGDYKIGTSTTPVTRPDGNNASLYEGSYIDNYLNTTYFNTLSAEIQNAIVDTTIKQNFYSQSGSNPLYSAMGYKPGTSSGEQTYWYNEGTAENPNWVKYDEHIPRDGEEGRLPLKTWTKQDKGYNGTVANEITRKIFLPSVEEISKVVDLNSQKEVMEFLKNTNGTNSHLWLRDSRSEDAINALLLSYDNRSLVIVYVTYNYTGVRPAYVLDLSRVTYNIEGKVNFKINGITYKAKEGSTWAEWVSSKYNTLGYTIDSNGNISKNNMYITNTNDINDKVSKTDVIVANTDYYASEFILPAGTKLTIGSKKYTVIEQKGSDQYLLMERDSIGNTRWNLSEDDGNVYENSYIDTYLNSTYFNTLSTEIQNAIVATTIKQNYYSLSGSGNNWSYGTRTDASGEYRGWWYNEGTSESPNWARCYNHIPVAENEGVYPFRCWVLQSKGYNSVESNEISRKIFLPSVEEVSKVINLSDELEVYNFLKNTNGSQSHMWLRDSRSEDATLAIGLGYDLKSLDYYYVTASIGVRPAYTLDLSQLDYNIE